jgi:hypothetical protein
MMSCHVSNYSMIHITEALMTDIAYSSAFARTAARADFRAVSRSVGGSGPRAQKSGRFPAA